MSACSLALLALSVGADADATAALVRDIEDNLIAPCCWSQTVSQHHSEAADHIRREVREMVSAGKGREEILEY